MVASVSSFPPLQSGQLQAHSGPHVADSIVIFPRVFAQGPRPSLSIEVVGEKFEEEFTSDLQPHEHDIAYSVDKPWERLLGSPVPGPMRAKNRGKLLTIIAGNVSKFTHFYNPILTLPQRCLSAQMAHEGTVAGMSRHHFNQIIAHDEIRPSGKDGQYLNYSFQIPNTPDFITPNSGPIPRRINIFAAIVSDDWVWVLVDRQRLMLCHLRLREEPWSVKDLDPNSGVSF